MSLTFTPRPKYLSMCTYLCVHHKKNAPQRDVTNTRQHGKVGLFVWCNQLVRHWIDGSEFVTVITPRAKWQRNNIKRTGVTKQLSLIEPTALMSENDEASLSASKQANYIPVWFLRPFWVLRNNATSSKTTSSNPGSSLWWPIPFFLLLTLSLSDYSQGDPTWTRQNFFKHSIISF